MASKALEFTLGLHLAPLPTTARGTPCCLASHPKRDVVAYCSGTNVVIRNLQPAENESPVEVLGLHAKQTTAVAYSPSGQWIASGDASGHLKVWGAHGDHVEKADYPVLTGAICDIAWSGDGQRIAVVGDGREKLGAVIIWDTGSKAGEISGHSKRLRTVAFRPNRPFRILTGGDEFNICYHEGPPFKFGHSLSLHTNFVNAIRHAPEGYDRLVSVGSDGKVHLIDSKTGQHIREFERPADLSGSVYGVAWRPKKDSHIFATVGGDKAIRLWDAGESGQHICATHVGEQRLQDMPLGVCWLAESDRVCVVTLDGRLLLYQATPKDTPTSLALTSTLMGSQRSYTSLEWVGADWLAAGSTDGCVIAVHTASYKANQGVGTLRVRVPNDKTVTHLTAVDGPTPTLFVVALDDCVRSVQLPKAPTEEASTLVLPISGVKLPGRPLGVLALTQTETTLLTVTTQSVMAAIATPVPADAGACTWERKVEAMPTCVGGGVAGKGKGDQERAIVAVGFRKQKGHVESFFVGVYVVLDASRPDGVQPLGAAGDSNGSSDVLPAVETLTGHQSEVTAVALTGDGRYVASGDSAKYVLLWDLDNLQVVHRQWVSYSSRITSLSWSPNDTLLAVASIDRDLYVWDRETPSRRAHIANAHKGGVTAARFMPAVEDAAVCLATAGADGALKCYYMK
ncbi:unnamed protein product [Vitrella brassicaformis CCMP3155]|uniref:Anaphase-promoting complex subunit 4 WD40 domain-containing protein n=4 Tax=Vitrella brassicaformis TaxID=1169539 RepID=A0A0G4FJC8_VITBC|nr:unnamed protein product [Vitrella brassicaformis CCMP3155]|eukprot:CEM13715.1 unnamed protein product [Vitrella brassicaformis CCMP3155]